MEILLLGIYSFFVWLIFFKFKWLPWNIVSQVIVITLPIIGLTALILLLNIVAPSSHDIRVVNYVIPINPPVRGLVIEVPIDDQTPHGRIDRRSEEHTSELQSHSDLVCRLLLEKKKK